MDQPVGHIVERAGPPVPRAPQTIADLRCFARSQGLEVPPPAGPDVPAPPLPGPDVTPPIGPDVLPPPAPEIPPLSPPSPGQSPPTAS